jgi:hypothetical protein
VATYREADPFAVNFLADTLDRRANAYDELDRTDDAAADRAHAGRLRGALAERQAREEAARNVPTLEAILGSSTFDSGRTLELGRLVNGNPDVVDHWVDIAGYAKLVSDRLQGVER